MIGGYDEALCLLSDQLEPCPGSEKLVFTLKIMEHTTVLDTILPRFRRVGVFKIKRLKAEMQWPLI